MEREDIVLIQKAQAGDQEAFAQVYERYYQSVFIKANALCRNEADAKDMVQDTFFEVHRSLKDLRDCSHFYSWLMMITVSKCHNMFRKKRHVAAFSDEMQDMQEERVYMDPKKVMDNLEEQRILHALVCELPANYAEILQLIYFEHCKLIEAAEILDIPLGTVKTRIVRAREILKKKVKLYEKREQRCIYFHEEALTVSMTLPLLRQLVTKSVKTGYMLSSNMLVSICICVCSVGTVLGAPYLYHTYLQTKEKTDIPTSQLPLSEVFPKKESTFPTVYYKEQVVDNNRKAYYYCLNFAKDESMMKNRKKQDFEEFIPVYENFKHENSPHYQSLQEQGWTELFEAYAFP